MGVSISKNAGFAVEGADLRCEGVEVVERLYVGVCADVVTAKSRNTEHTIKVFFMLIFLFVSILLTAGMLRDGARRESSV